MVRLFIPYSYVKRLIYFSCLVLNIFNLKGHYKLSQRFVRFEHLRYSIQANIPHPLRKEGFGLSLVNGWRAIGEETPFTRLCGFGYSNLNVTFERAYGDIPRYPECILLFSTAMRLMPLVTTSDV